ncbi:hypothetical protein PSHT_02470 [Puccinia striiformis]|uniref:Uncharacterized protein n=1 Tax=Puccinia striiformis TaxID=27350 RepID=A0A2S4WHY5_9BASI|nr:hypothetical protein PSHT_02470 [Puccinia striiformis]
MRFVTPVVIFGAFIFQAVLGTPVPVPASAETNDDPGTAHVMDQPPPCEVCNFATVFRAVNFEVIIVLPSNNPTPIGRLTIWKSVYLGSPCFDHHSRSRTPAAKKRTSPSWLGLLPLVIFSLTSNPLAPELLFSLWGISYLDYDFCGISQLLHLGFLGYHLDN